jgi:hypothetical protein
LLKEAKPGGFRDRFGRTVDASYAFGGMIDDMYRSMAYLYGKDKAARRGLGAQPARMAGIELSNRILQNWDRMTPLERTVVRYVWPFASWMKHIMAYTFTMPFDHPVRVSIINSFVEAEREDADSGLPDQFHQLFTLGRPNEYGDVKTINPGGMNPFTDVANYFTLSGFIGQLNPVASGMLTMMGVDERSGSAELHPTLVYDPVSGKLVAARRGPVEVFPTAIIPQIGGVADLISQSQQLKELRATRPDVFKARVLGAFGLPAGMIPRRTNEAEARARAELARYTAVRQAGSRVMRGDHKAAEGYTSLERIAKALRAQVDAAGRTP